MLGAAEVTELLAILNYARGQPLAYAGQSLKLCKRSRIDVDALSITVSSRNSRRNYLTICGTDAAWQLDARDRSNEQSKGAEENSCEVRRAM